MGAQKQARADRLEAECDALYPTSGQDQKIWLYDALSRIVRDVPWLDPHLSNDVAASLAVLQERAWEGAAQSDRIPAARRKGGEFGVADAMIGTGEDLQPIGIQVFRGIAWLAFRVWRHDGAYARVQEDLASVLRAVTWQPMRDTAAMLDDVLGRLGQVGDLGEAIEVLSILATIDHQALQRAWTKHLCPTLRGLHRGQQPMERTAGFPPADKPPHGRKGASNGPRHPTGERPGSGGVAYTPLIRRRRRPDQTPDEPADEACAPVFLASVPGYGTGQLARDQAEYRARQAIRGRNDLLLTCHIEAMFPDVYGQALHTLIARLEAADPATDRATGLLGCLLVALTGRTIAALRSIRLGIPPEDKLIERLWLDVDTGSFTFPPYWKETVVPDAGGNPEEVAATGYFRATAEQHAYLEPVCDRIMLPVLPPVRRVLSRHRQAMVNLSGLHEHELRDRMIGAMGGVARTLGLPVTVANLRRALGPLVMEKSGDVAMAQLICGDSFGRPSAQQHYYAPKRKHIAATYHAVMQRFLAESRAPVLPKGGSRIGSELLLRPEAAKRLAKASHEYATRVSGDLVAKHRGILDHCVRMVLATSGHRWCSALFELTLRDVDLHTGTALFADKKQDVAHDPRLVCLPKILCKQLTAYLDHIVRLVATCPGLQAHIHDVLTGGAPLMFDLQEHEGSLMLEKPKLADVRARGPDDWDVVPCHWGRTYIRTRAIEMGCPPFLVACQLGHYDAVGYPFSCQSPTDPIEVVQALRPWLDRVARTQRWEVVEPTSSLEPADEMGAPASLAYPCLPLEDWREPIAAAESRARKAYKAWDQSQRSNTPEQTERAMQAVLANKTAVQAGISAVYNGEAGATLSVPLEQVDAHRIHLDLLADCDDDAGAAMRRHRAWRRVLKVVAKHAGEPVPTVARLIVVRRPLDNAFFRGACLALGQVHYLRRHIRSLATVKKPKRTWEKQVARTALALVLYGGIEDTDTVVGILAARTRARPSASIPDLLLVPLGGGRVVALRGVAAIALGNLSQSYPDQPLPSGSGLGRAVVEFLPEWSSSRTKTSLLERLCSTVAVANRFELSPAARFALDPEHGSVSATIDEQLAFIDRDVAGPERPRGKKTPPRLARRCVPHMDPAATRSSAGAQYRILCGMIPVRGRDWTSPRTGTTVKSVNVSTAPAHELVSSELRDWMEQSDRGQSEVLWSIMRMLVGWVWSESTRKVKRGEYLRYSSIRTYLARIGRSLVRELGDVELPKWTERLMEDAYGYALEASSEARHKVAAALASFHRYTATEFDLPEVDMTQVYAEMKAGDRHVDAAMVLPVERKGALARLERAAWFEQSAKPEERRIARQADAIAPLLAFGGMRVSEPLGMQLRDMGRRPDGELWARARSNRLRGLKTRAATRLVHLTQGIGNRALDRTWEWHQGVWASSERRPESTYLVSALDHPTDLREQAAVTQVIRTALRDATGRESERLHRLRHLVATERITRVALSEQDAAWLGTAQTNLHDAVLEPRDMNGISVPLGQAHWRTTIQWYLHLPWVLQSHWAQRMRDGSFERRTVAAVLGLTPSALDNVTRGETVPDQVRAWCGYVLPARARPTVPDTKRDSKAAPMEWAWTAVMVGELVRLAGKTKDLMTALSQIGAPQATADALEQIAARWERKLGQRLLPDEVGGTKRSCPGRAVRVLRADAPLTGIWQLLDEGTPEEQGAVCRVVQDCYAHWVPGDGHGVVLPSATAGMLRAMLSEIGVPPHKVVTQDQPGALERIVILRPQSSHHTARYSGRGIKRVLAIAGLAIDLQSSSCRGS